MADSSVSNNPPVIVTNTSHADSDSDVPMNTFISGRPPWYSSDGKPRKPFVVGLAGGTACGKTTVCRKVIDELGLRWVVFLSMDSFYMNLAPDVDPTTYDFDSPDAFDWELMLETLQSLKEGRAVRVPIYDFTTNSRRGYNTVYGADVVLFEGLFTLYDERIRNVLDLKIYVDADPDVRLSRRLRRDQVERGRDVPSILHQYETFVKPAFHAFIEPTLKFADIILPYGTGEPNAVGVDLIVRTIRTTLTERGVPFRDKLRGRAVGNDEVELIPPSFHLIEGSQIKALLTILRDETTPRDDFVFFAHRLMRLVIEDALSYLPMEDVEVMTPTGYSYTGTRPTTRICGVSIIRAGEAMEKALREVAQDVRIGKILIQTNRKTKEPQLFFDRLPSDIGTRSVLLMDPVTGTGATAMMAIRVLLDHGVLENDIIFVCLIAAVPAVFHLAYSFPGITIVAAALDDLVDEKFYVRPGVGNFGARYFGDHVASRLQSSASEDTLSDDANDFVPDAAPMPGPTDSDIVVMQSPSAESVDRTAGRDIRAFSVSSVNSPTTSPDMLSPR